MTRVRRTWGLPSSLIGRFLTLTALWITVALCAAWLIIGGVLDRFVVARIDAELAAASDALLAELDVVGGELVLTRPPAVPRFARPLSGWFWQVVPADDPAADALLVSESLFLDALLPPFTRAPDGQPLVVQQRRATIPGWNAPIVIVVTAPWSDVAATQAAVRGPLFWSLAALGGGLAALAIVQGRMALSGYRHIGAGITAIRSGQAERLPRRDLTEVDAPIDEINALLDQNRAVMIRSRNHVGNLAHALKTPLAAILNDAPPGSDAAHTAERMDRLIQYHLRRARGVGAARLLGARTPVLDVAEDIALVLRGMARDRGIALGVDVPETLDFAGEREDLEEICGNLAENAVQWARHRVDLTAHQDDRDMILTVTDDGSGIPDTALAHVLERGGRLDESVAGTGLGLGIVADLVDLNGGQITFATADGGGLCVSVRLPMAAPLPLV